MIKAVIRSILLLLILISGSCLETPSEIKAIQYFDIPSFFESETKRLDSSGKTEIKLLKTADEQESVSMKPESWKDELAIFSNIDLNKSSYIGKYVVDTSMSNNGIIVTYKTNDDKLPVKYCAFEMHADSVKWLEVRKEDKSMILSSELFWRFVPDSGYFVSGSQQIGNLSPSIYEVSVIFAN
ncbi:MAG: hypothetical protein WED33_07140 [Bacteroidia bacterium]